MKITVLAPAYNEEAVIEQFVGTVMRKLAGQNFEVLIVNDGSTDKTGDILSDLLRHYPNLKVVTHAVNMGLGEGLKTGFRYAIGDIIVTLDADLSQDPGLIPIMVSKILDGHDVVIASRYVKGGGMLGIPWWRTFISQLGNTLIRFATGIRVKDCTSGMRAYKADIAKKVTDIGIGFEVQLKILNQLKTYNLTEIPLMLTTRAAGQSKMRYLNLIPKYLYLLTSLK